LYRFYRSFAAIALGTAASISSPAFAEVAELNDDHFITRAEAVVDADKKATWLALISPARWWSGEHTWSADAANLKLTPQAGGCFCETIPEVDEPGRFTLQGSVEHMRVIQAYPEVALRMAGGLGPLQSEPVAGILTIALSDAAASEDGSARTKIVWEYNVGGKMRYPVPVIATAVDGVMTLQLTRLAELLGAIEVPSTAQAGLEESIEGGEAADETAPDEASNPGIDSGEAVAEDDEPSVDEAFDDLGGSSVAGEQLLDPGA